MKKLLFILSTFFMFMSIGLFAMSKIDNEPRSTSYRIETKLIDKKVNKKLIRSWYRRVGSAKTLVEETDEYYKYELNALKKKQYLHEITTTETYRYTKITPTDKVVSSWTETKTSKKEKWSEGPTEEHKGDTKIVYK